MPSVLLIVLDIHVFVYEFIDRIPIQFGILAFSCATLLFFHFLPFHSSCIFCAHVSRPFHILFHIISARFSSDSGHIYFYYIRICVSWINRLAAEKQYCRLKRLKFIRWSYVFVHPYHNTSLSRPHPFHWPLARYLLSILQPQQLNEQQQTAYNSSI